MFDVTFDIHWCCGGGHFYWLEKTGYSEKKTTFHNSIKLYYLKLCEYIWASVGENRTHFSLMVVGTNCIGCCKSNYYMTVTYVRGGSRGGGVAPGARPPLKLEKIWFFGVKSWFFTRNTPKIFAPPSAIGKHIIFGVKSWFFTRNTPTFFAPPPPPPPLRSAQFFKCAPPNLKSWIRPCMWPQFVRKT